MDQNYFSPLTNYSASVTNPEVATVPQGAYGPLELVDYKYLESPREVESSCVKTPEKKIKHRKFREPKVIKITKLRRMVINNSGNLVYDESETMSVSQSARLVSPDIPPLVGGGKRKGKDTSGGWSNAYEKVTGRKINKNRDNNKGNGSKSKGGKQGISLNPTPAEIEEFNRAHPGGHCMSHYLTGNCGRNNCRFRHELVVAANDNRPRPRDLPINDGVAIVDADPEENEDGLSDGGSWRDAGSEEGAADAALAKARLNSLSKQFLVHKHPNVRTLFDNQGLPAEPAVYDCGGAPFCGMVAIDVALMKSPTFSDYFDLAQEFVFDIEGNLGVPEFLRKYAAYNGVNLSIFMDNARGDRVLICNYANSPGFKWVNLLFVPGHQVVRGWNGQAEADPEQIVARMEARLNRLNNDEPENEAEPDIGHYYLICARVSSLTNIHSSVSDTSDVNWPITIGIWSISAVAATTVAIVCPIIPIKMVVSFLASLAFKTRAVDTMTVGQSHLYHENNDDLRSIPDRRETIQYFDTYREFNKKFKINIGFTCCVPSIGGGDGEFILGDWRPHLRGLLGYGEGQQFVDGGIGFKSRQVNIDREFSGEDWIGKHVLGCSDYLVSDTRLVQAYGEMQMLSATGRDPMLALPSISRYREVNTDIARSVVLLDTCRIARFYGERLPKARYHGGNHGLVVYNANNLNAIIEAGPAVGHNQLIGGGPIDVHGRIFPSNIKKASIRQVKFGKPVAVAPIGVPIAREGFINAGQFSLTDNAGLVAAFIGRTMQKCYKDFDEPEIDRFITFSHSLIDKWCGSLCLNDMVEPDCRSFFAEHYKGIKKSSDIQRILDQHELFYSGALVSSEAEKFCNHSCFVKFESNCKTSGSMFGAKPRLIMTMSDRFLVDTCPILMLIHKWNSSSFSCYQVKEMEPDEMIRRIQEVTDCEHNVTDYSSFEASINSMVREVELYCLEKLCDKAGFTRTKRQLDEIRRQRILKRRGFEARIGSRCSGDFWTSFGNGLINALLVLYMASNKGCKLNQFLVEGDDGIIPTAALDIDLMTRLGFKLSQDQHGYQCGDNDFLQSRWVSGKRYLSVGRMLRMLWVKGAASLKRSKQLFILRCMGNSLHCLSPGHPVLCEIVNLIGRETSGKTRFRGFEKYLDQWKKTKDDKGYPRNVVPDESMREEIAKGGNGFPPISVLEQLELEERIRNTGASFYLGDILNDYADVKDKMDAYKLDCPDGVMLLDAVCVVNTNDVYGRKSISVSKEALRTIEDCKQYSLTEQSLNRICK